jgi:hypothetical protein
MLRRASKSVLVLMALAGVVALMTGSRAGAGGPTQKVDLSTNDAVNAFLTSIGVNPAGVTIQRGFKNYAGPKCPGVGWSCTTATMVVQVAPQGGANRFECGDPALVGLDPVTIFGTVPSAPYSGARVGSCLAVQQSDVGLAAGPPGENEGRCHKRDRQTTSPAAMAQDCRIVQMNERGPNNASVHMLIDQNAKGSTQTAQQTAAVIQQNGTGPNHSHVTEIIKQDTHEDAAGTGGIGNQTQEAHQSACVWQGGAVTPPTTGCPAFAEGLPSSGDNDSHVHQEEDQSAKLKNATSSDQHQNTGASTLGDCNTAEGFVTEPNECARIDQKSTVGKADSFRVTFIKQDERTSATTGSQIQGSPVGGIDGDVNQQAGVPVKDHDVVDERQNAVAGDLIVPMQFAPSWCCTTAIAPGGNVEIHESSTQSATVSEAPLDESVVGVLNDNEDKVQDSLIGGKYAVSSPPGTVVGGIRIDIVQDGGRFSESCPPEEDESGPLAPTTTPSACVIVAHQVNGEPAATCPPGFFFDPETGRCEEIDVE